MEASEHEGAPPTRQERARLLAADQALQALLVSYGLVEDWEARILEELARPDEPSGQASGLGLNTTLRRMRQTGALGALDESAQSTLLGSTLYQYSRDAPPIRAVDARQQAPAAEANTTMGATSNLGASQAIQQLRHRVERVLHGDAHGGANLDTSELPSSLNSTMVDGQGADLGNTVGVLEGHLSPLDETAISLQGRLAPLAETTSSLGSLADGNLRDPARDTADSWAMAGTSRTVLNGSQEGDRTGLIMRLLNAGELDESLERSVRRVMQLGTVLTGDRLSTEEIDGLPKVHFDLKEEQQCSICLEAFQTGELLTQLPCSHFFHVDCVSKWFQQSTQCPLCRGKIAGG